MSQVHQHAVLIALNKILNQVLSLSFHDSGFLSKMTGRTNIEMEEAFLFDKSLIVCHNKGKTQMFGSDDEYSFWIRFPMNILKVGLIFMLTISFSNSIAGWGSVSREPVLRCVGSNVNLWRRSYLRGSLHPRHCLDAWSKNWECKESVDERDPKDNWPANEVLQ